jgi:hypothetical protein
MCRGGKRSRAGAPLLTFPLPRIETSANSESQRDMPIMSVRSGKEAKRCVGDRGCSRWQLYAMLLCIILQINVASGEDATESDQTDVDALIGGDSIILVLIFLLFALCMSFWGGVLGFVAELDDSIMRRYYEEGEVVHANIISTKFARGGKASGGGACISDNHIEYTAVVEYDRMASTNYRIKVRKQLRVREADFISPDIPELKAFKSSKGKYKKRSKIEIQVDTEALQKNDHLQASQEIFFRKCTLENRTLELLVLPEHPKSGYPQNAVERAGSLRYRSTTLLLAVANMLLAAFSLLISARHISEQEDKEHRRIAWTIFWIFVGLIVLQMPVIYYLLNTLLKKSVEAEYYELGELAQTAQDDSSLSSRTDSCLTTARYYTVASTQSLGKDSVLEASFEVGSLPPSSMSASSQQASQRV